MAAVSAKLLPRKLRTPTRYIANVPAPGSGRVLQCICYITYCDCIPSWDGWLLWTLYGQDREASLITQLHHGGTIIIIITMDT